MKISELKCQGCCGRKLDPDQLFFCSICQAVYCSGWVGKSLLLHYMSCFNQHLKTKKMAP